MTQSLEQPNAKLAQSYNDLPYPSYSFPHCNPVRLHALARMKGLNPAPLENAKVLEIGCSFGGNLLSFALQFPNSFSIGIDLAEAQVQEGQRMLNYAGISNVQLVAADISKVRFETQFDYIICHGVFSWVPDFVQRAILATIQQYLSPNGVAFVSYNAYPGWKNKDIAKDLMLFGSNPNLPRAEQLHQALEMVKFTKEIFDGSKDPFRKHMNQVFDNILTSSKSYIAHEFLEDYNQPMYFKQFTRLVAEFGLAYVTETCVPHIYNNGINQEKIQDICHYFENRLDDITQYFDFIANIAFRCDMITHQTNLDQHQLTNDLAQFNRCYHFNDIYLRVVPVQLITEDGVEYWSIARKIKYERSEAVDLLCQYLQEMSGNRQIKRIMDDLKKQPGFDKEQIHQLLWMLVHSSCTDISFQSQQIKSYGKKPKISEARRKLLEFIAVNPDITGHTDIFGNHIKIRETSVYFSRYLDGTRTIKGLMKEYKQEVKNGGFVMKKADGEVVPFEKISNEEIEYNVTSMLDELAYCGYFE